LRWLGYIITGRSGTTGSVIRNYTVLAGINIRNASTGLQVAPVKGIYPTAASGAYRNTSVSAAKA